MKGYLCLKYLSQLNIAEKKGLLITKKVSNLTKSTDKEWRKIFRRNWKKILVWDLLSHILFQAGQIKKTVLEHNKTNSY